MKRIATGLALATALLGWTLAGTALGQESHAPQAQSFHGQNGNWGQDSYHQDRNGNGWGWGRINHMNLEGRWVADNRSAGYENGFGFRGRGGMGGILLPSFIDIDQRPSMIRIEDSRNRVLQRIVLGGKFDSRSDRFGNRPDYLVGRWRGSTLVVEHMGPRGAMLTQTFALENRGRSLVVRTRRETGGPRGTTEFTTVYHRA
jgi:hypothetical protein